MEFKNKYYLPPMAKEGSIDGKPDPSLIDYYEDMAKKGFGLIILEHAYVNIKGKASPKQMSIDENYDRDTLIKIKDAIHKHGAKAFMQISHAGRNAKASDELFGPSDEEGVRKLTINEIKKLEDDFLKAAIRVKEMGFDGVEIHSAHGYLLNQFYSPLVNKRDDMYGGCLENRLRFLLEIIEKIKNEIPDFPIFVRLGACDYIEFGNELDDAIEASKILEDYIDFIDISGGIKGFLTYNDAEYGYFTKEAKAIKDNTKLSVMVTGGIKNKEEADKILDKDLVDMVGIGRASLKKDFTLLT